MAERGGFEPAQVNRFSKRLIRRIPPKAHADKHYIQGVIGNLREENGELPEQLAVRAIITRDMGHGIETLLQFAVI